MIDTTWIIQDFVGEDEHRVVHFVDATTPSARAACKTVGRVYTRETEAVTCLRCLGLKVGFRRNYSTRRL